MIPISQLYEATDGGLYIMKKYLPDFREDGKKFKMREEDDASACARLRKGVWRVTDFGDDAHEMDPLDVAKRNENGKTIGEIICLLADEFGVVDTRINEANKDRISKRAASKEEIDGFMDLENARKGEKVVYCRWEAKAFSPEELELMVPRKDTEKTQAVLTEYAWESLAWYSLTRRDDTGEIKTTVFYSTPTFPIFLRDCHYKDSNGKDRAFQKIYKPLSYDKQFRFFYSGIKPQKWINGLAELRRAVEEYRKASEDPEHQEKVSGEKLPAAVICCGERDSMCCAAFGVKPLWFNSETYNSAITEWEIKEIMSMVNTLYYIPDLDRTGIRKAVELVERFPKIHLVWLPEDMQRYKDARGKVRKDLRDWTELHPDYAEFNHLLDMGMPFEFWQKIVDKKGERMIVNTAYFLNCLRCLGFGIYSGERGEEYVRVVDNRVQVFPAGNAIKRFMLNYMRDYPPHIRNVMSDSAKLSESTFSQMGEIKLDFTHRTHDSQDLFFQNGICRVSKDGARMIKYPDYDRQVWEKRVVPHNFKRLEPAFSIRRDDDGWHIDVRRKDSYFFKYLMQTSRMYWREELEERTETLTPEQRAAYLEENKVSINGSLLSEEERREQEQHLISKIFAAGYLLHRHKFEERPWIVYAMDYRISEIGDANGRSGKSLFMSGIGKLLRKEDLDGRQGAQLTENKHCMERVSRDTDLVLVDDASPYLDMDFFFTCTTSGMVINPKFKESYVIPYKDSPKLAITTNYAPNKSDKSTMGRLLFIAFSDYYHVMGGGNDYAEDRNPFTDLGLRLMDEQYSEDNWNFDFNFLVDCLQFYLSTIEDNVKLDCPLENIIKRMRKQEMGEAFEDWATAYFAPDGPNVNCLVVREKMTQDFQLANRNSKYGSRAISKALKAFCEFNGYRLNPEEAGPRDRKGRFIRKIDGESKECYYIQTPGAPINVQVLGPENPTQQF